MDTLSKERRSWNMSRIRSRDTGPEKLVRSALRRLGYHFTLYARQLPGNPDIVLSRRRLAVFVHGCFWHRHRGCKFAYTPKSHVSFWKEKFSDNVVRDHLRKKALRKLGWRVGVIWECETRDRGCLERRVQSLLKNKSEEKSGPASRIRGCMRLS